jgi:hypothetical protein
LLTSIDIEGDLDLGNTLRGRRNANKVEIAEELVVADELTLSLEDLDLNGRLAVGSGREDLRLLGWDGGVTRNEPGHDTAKGLNT